MERLETVEAVNMVGGDIDCLDHDTYCIRGLETDLFPSIREHQKERVKTVVKSVIDHQSLYGMIGIPASSIAATLSAISRKDSAPSLEKARTVAVLDSAVV